MATFSIGNVKRNYPDEWILPGNPEIDEQNQVIIAGVVLYHSLDKKEAVYLGKPRAAGYEKTIRFFNRATLHRKRDVILSECF
ncbi:MAG: hypothetical protein LBC47_07575 [Tannerella sp.]|jgi:hypothetical protein|nr:hypothetical protein [Tannerella sp.]